MVQRKIMGKQVKIRGEMEMLTEMVMGGGRW